VLSKDNLNLGEMINLKEGVWVKKNNWLLYFIYAVVFSCYIIFTNKILIFLGKQSEKSFEILPLMICSMILFIVLGLFLGAERLLLETRKDGKWKINLPKLILLGVPSLYASVGMFLFFCPIEFIQKLYLPMMLFNANKTNFLPIFQVILGYIIITSFVKVKV